MSYFNSLMKRRGAPLLKTVLAERDGQGELAAIEYFPPGKDQGVPVVGGIRGNIQGDVQEDTNTGEEVKIERLAYQVPVAELTKHDITKLQVRSKLKLQDGEWAVDVSQSKWGDHFVDFSLVRDVLVSGKRFEGGSV